MSRKAYCIDCGQPMKNTKINNKNWYTCSKCGTSMTCKRFREMMKEIKMWKRTKIGRIWNNHTYNQ